MNDEEKKDSDKEKECPLSLNDWVIFLNNEINNLESGEYQKSNIFYIIVALFATTASAIVSFVLSTVSIANPPQNAVIKIPLNDVIYIIRVSSFGFMAISLFFIFFVGYWLYQMIWVYPKNKKTAHDLKDIIKSIIEGDIKETIEVRKKWTLVMQSRDQDIKKWLENKFKGVILESETQKIQLVQLLLLIGTLLAAFNLVKDWVWMYPFFALFSIIYFIVIQKPIHSKGQKDAISIISFVIATFFSGLLNGNLFISIPKASISSPIIILLYVLAILVLFILYFIFFTFILWFALKKDQNIVSEDKILHIDLITKTN